MTMIDPTTTAASAAEDAAQALHDAGQCSEIEWSCSHCERGAKGVRLAHTLPGPTCPPVQVAPGMSAAMDALPSVDHEVLTRECTWWCDTVADGHGHQHPADRACWSAALEVSLSTHKPHQYSEGPWWHDHLNAYLRRNVNETTPLVLLHHEEDDTELYLTLSEAARLRDILEALLTTAEAVSE